MTPTSPKIQSNHYSQHNQVALLKGGKQYFDGLLDLIKTAVHTIHIQTYILDDDETGKQVTEALLDARKRNVAVYVMADGYASQSLSDEFLQSLKDAGIHFRYFEPLLRSKYFYFGRRMHHKISVADNKLALVGGVNIANRYNDMPDQPAWLDFGLLVQGEIVSKLYPLCWSAWKNYPLKLKSLDIKEVQTERSSIFSFQDCEVRMRRNDWIWRKNEISKTYIEMFQQAKKEIIILCSYFLPGTMIRSHLIAAIKRGVTVRVVAAGPSDIMLAKKAERWLYDWLLRNGIELYEYQKNVLHGKIAVCDEQWITIGSYNINNISAYASIELNLDVKQPLFAQSVHKTLKEIIEKDCIQITKEQQLKTRNIFKQFSRWFSYQFIRITFNLFTFYYRQRT